MKKRLARRALPQLWLPDDEYTKLEHMATAEGNTVDEWLTSLVNNVVADTDETCTLVILSVPNNIYDAYNEDDEESPQNKICRYVADEGDRMIDGKNCKAGTGKIKA